MRRVMITTTAALAALLSSVALGQDKGGAGDPQQQLGGEIKAAVFLGIIDRAESEEIFKQLLDFESGGLDRDAMEKDGGDGAKWSEDDKRRGGMTFARFEVRDGGDFSTLLRPEFSRRDTRLLVEALDEAAGMTPVVESLIEDYERAFEEAADAFREALRASSESYQLAEVETILDRLPAVPLAREVIDRRVMEWDEEFGKGRRDTGMVSDWAEGRIAGLADRVSRLRGLVAERRISIETEDPRSARELLAMMDELRERRVALRSDFENNLRSVASEEQWPAVDATLDRIRLEHGRADARFGGAGIDLELAVTRSELPEDLERGIVDGMASGNERIADLVDRRTEARIEREARSARLLASELENDTARIASRTQAVRNAADREIAAGIAVRDAILVRMDEIHADILEADPELAADFLEIARRDGFPDQMRRRWCERAVEAALELPDLDEAVIAALVDLRIQVLARLLDLRVRAIEDRLELEPRVGRAMAAGVEDDFTSAKSMGDETWREPGFEAFDRLDDEIGGRLLLLLGPDLAAALPPHSSLGTDRGKGAESKGGSSVDKGAATGGKGGAKGARRGVGK